jgi:hypothetical protein
MNGAFLLTLLNFAQFTLQNCKYESFYDNVS